jgi:hypothetical protein
LFLIFLIFIIKLQVNEIVMYKNKYILKIVVSIAIEYNITFLYLMEKKSL